MKAIRDLGRLRGTCCGAAGIVLSPVTGNDFDAWMVAQPRRDGLGCALRQEIHRPTLFEIHQDGAIDPALAEGKIIDAQDPGWGWVGAGVRRRIRRTVSPLQRHPQAGGHPRTGFAARLAPEDADGLGQPPGTLRVRGGERGRRSAKVWRGHVGVRQRKRRTCKRRRTGCSTTGRSRRRRV